jgi:hypothetical protein
MMVLERSVLPSNDGACVAEWRPWNFEARQRFGFHMKRMSILGLLLWTTVLAVAPLRPAHAYIDPNSAGPLYQMLFPLLIAIGSAVAMLRRAIARAWSRVATAVISVVRGERAGS